MKGLLFLLLLVLGSSIAHSATKDNAILVELFTSQGCSSCPAADRFAGDLIKNHKAIVLLSLPVTYWDRLGWKDTLAQARWTKRQRLYARAFGNSTVYTPQMIIDGKLYGVGSRRSQILQLIKRREANRKADLNIELDQYPEFLRLSIAGKALKKAAKIWRVNFIKEKVVEIGAGENSGRTLTYYHIPKSITEIGSFQGGVFKRDLRLGKDYDGVAIFVQRKRDYVLGEVLGTAAWVKH